jgi:hypothetical protein
MLRLLRWATRPLRLVLLAILLVATVLGFAIQARVAAVQSDEQLAMGRQALDAGDADRALAHSPRPFASILPRSRRAANALVSSASGSAGTR